MALTPETPDTPQLPQVALAILAAVEDIYVRMIETAVETWVAQNLFTGMDAHALRQAVTQATEAATDAARAKLEQMARDGEFDT